MKRFFFIFFFLALLFLIGTVKNTFAQTVCPAGGQCRNYNTNALCVAAGGTPQFCTGNLGLGNCCIPAAPTSTPTPTPTPITCPAGGQCRNYNTTTLCYAAGGTPRPCTGNLGLGNCCIPAAPTSTPTPTRTQNPCPGGGNCANTNTTALCVAAGGTARACTGPPGVSIGNCCTPPLPTPTPITCPSGATCRSYLTPDLCDAAGGTPEYCKTTSGTGNCCVGGLKDCVKDLSGVCRTSCQPTEVAVAATGCTPGRLPQYCCKPKNLATPKACPGTCKSSCAPGEVQYRTYNVCEPQGRICCYANFYVSQVKLPLFCVGNDPKQRTTSATSGKIATPIGCIPVSDKMSFTPYILRWAIGIAGGIAFLFIVYSGFLIITSGGNVQKISAGKELLTASLMGLFLLIFSVYILKIFGVDIFNIPGLT